MSTEAISGVRSFPAHDVRNRNGSHVAAEWKATRPEGGFARRYTWQVIKTSLPLWLADQIALLLALALPTAISTMLGADVANFSWVVIPLFLGLFIANFGLGLYPGIGLVSVAELHRCVLSTSIVFGVFFLATALREGMTSAHCLLLGASWVISAGLLPYFRRIARRFASKTRWWGQPVLILGGDATGAKAFRKLRAAPEQGLRPIGVLDDYHRQWTNSTLADSESYLGPLEDAPQIAAEHRVYWGLVSMACHEGEHVARVIDRYSSVFPHLVILPDLGNPARLWHGAHECGGLAGMRFDERLLLPWPRFLKRSIDLAITIIGGLVILPFVALIALAVKATSRGPIFYSQERIGLDGRRFRAWKFRSMVANADQILAEYLQRHPELNAEWKCNHKLKYDPRITRVGRVLRKTSLDELPQLWNVIQGQMSLVGPRPIVHAEIAKYGTAYGLYQRVVPGITGLWQISGRNNTTYERRVELDMRYVRNWSIWFDVQILFATIKVVLFCKGAY
jgi:Undecaprenyl-phosphate galactose phosphotransferase WbaP